MNSSKGRRLSQEQKDYIVTEYKKQRLTYKEIAQNIGLSAQSVADFIRREKNKGNLKKQDRLSFSVEGLNRARQNPSKKPYSNRPNLNTQYEHESNPDVDVNCTPYVASKCIYGCYGKAGYCNFMHAVGRARIHTSPDHKHCHEFIKIDKDHRRIITRGEN